MSPATQERLTGLYRLLVLARLVEETPEKNGTWWTSNLARFWFFSEDETHLELLKELKRAKSREDAPQTIRRFVERESRAI